MVRMMMVLRINVHVICVLVSARCGRTVFAISFLFAFMFIVVVIAFFLCRIVCLCFPFRFNSLLFARVLLHAVIVHSRRFRRRRALWLSRLRWRSTAVRSPEARRVFAIVLEPLRANVERLVQHAKLIRGFFARRQRTDATESSRARLHWRPLTGWAPPCCADDRSARHPFWLENRSMRG